MNNIQKTNVFMLMLLIYLCLAPYTIILMIFPAIDFISKNIIILYFIQPLFCFIIPFFAYILVTKNKIKTIIPLKKLSLRNILLISAISFSIQPISVIISAVMGLFFNNDASDALVELSNNKFILLFTCVAVLPAICEEIVFRGIILSGYKKTSSFKAATVSALFFGMMHLNPHQFSYTFIIGIIFSYLVIYTGSIYSSILAHFIINGSQIILLYVSKAIFISESSQNTVLTYNDKMNIVKESISAGLPFIPIFIILFYIFINSNKQNKIDYTYDISDKSMELNLFEIINHKNKKIFDVFFILIILTYSIYIIIYYF